MERGYFLTLLLCFALGVQGQSNDSRLTLHHADAMTVIQVNGQSTTLLSGHVAMSNANGEFQCDSAVWNRQSNDFQAFGQVSYQGNNGLILHADMMHHQNGWTNLHQNIELKHGNQTLATDNLRYHDQREIGRFTQGGTVTTTDATLTAREGTYHASREVFTYHGDVKAKTKQYTLDTDSLIHDLPMHQYIMPVAGYAVSDSGWVRFGQGIISDSNELSIFHHGVTGQDGRDYFIADSLHRQASIATTGLHGHEQGATQGKDSMELAADHLVIHGDSAKGQGHVVSHSKGLASLSESLDWNKSTHSLHLEGDPIVWSTDYQVQGRDIYWYQDVSYGMDSLWIEGQVVLSEPTDSGDFQQMGGNTLSGHLNHEGIHDMHLSGNAKAIYHPEPMQVNVTECSSITLAFKANEEGNQTIHSVTFNQSPQGTLSEDQADDLPGFSDRQSERPERMDWMSGLK